MDIQYLLWLQDFRNGIDNALTPFMEWISDFAVTYLILIPVFIYWFWDKRKGLYPLVAYYFCMVLTPLIKLSACVYRPWIRDSRILPAGDSMTSATGYSFPSGHTTTCAPLAAGSAAALWEKRRMRVFSVLLFLFILLTAFSRNYLGVHTPQDVAVALLVSALSLFLASRLISYLERKPEMENRFLLGGFLLCCAILLFFHLKSYPMDLNEEGKLVVDPQKMLNDGFGDIGKMMGFCIFRFVEKTWIRFRPRRIGWQNAALCAAGLVLMILLKKYVSPLIVSWLGSHWGKLLFSVLYTGYYIALFPLVLKLLGKTRFFAGPAEAA